MAADQLDVTLLAADDPGVEAELQRFFEACPHSFAQQTPQWRDVISQIDRDEPLFLGCRRAGELVGVLPGYRFEGPLGAVLNSVPQAGPLGGVACRSEASEGVEAADVYRALVEAYLELGRSTNCAFASLITNPFWPDLELYQRACPPDYLLRNTCQALDLEAALDASGELLLASRSLRRNLRRARDGSLVIDETQSAENVASWYAIHDERHREIGATPLPEALFTGALEHMVDAGKARFFFVRLADTGEMVAGGFYIHHACVIDALMPAMRSRHAELGPNVVLALHSIRWARQRGLRWYNWQGSPPEGGVRRFKMQWGSQDVEYAYLTWQTGDAEPMLRASPDAIRRGYPWHYVLPFDRLGQGACGQRGESTRSGAWQAGEDLS